MKHLIRYNQDRAAMEPVCKQAGGEHTQFVSDTDCFDCVVGAIRLRDMGVNKGRDKTITKEEAEERAARRAALARKRYIELKLWENWQ